MKGFIRRFQNGLMAWIPPILLVVCNSVQALASESKPTQNDANQDDLESSLEMEISSAERISNHTSLQFGLGYRRGPGVELGLDLYRDEDNLFIFKLGHFTSKNQEGFTDLHVSHFLAENAFFLGESLFVGIGASLGWFRGQDREKGVVSSEGTQDFSFDASAYQATFSMSAGNQWQLEEWTFGFHWLNLYLPFYVTPVQKTSGENNSGSFSVREIKRKQDLSSTAWQIDYGVSLDIGYSF